MTPDTVVRLGDFEFQGFEVPPEIPFGGEQQLVIHKLPGGRRVVDAMGRDDSQLEWRGIITGPNAEDRARYLDGLRVRGDELVLTWSRLRYRVVIQSLELVFKRFYHVPYRICCVVIEDQTTPVTRVPSVSLDETFRGDLDKAKELGAEIDDSIITQGLDAIDEAISTVSDIATAAQDTIKAVLTPIVAVQQRVSTLIGTLSNTAKNITTLGGLFPNNPIAAQVTKFATASATYTQIPKLYALQSTLGRMDVSLSQAAGLGNAVRSIRTVGGDLFGIAQSVYGDATKWSGIASANGMDDPFFTDEKDLKVPENPADTGGVVGGV